MPAASGAAGDTLPTAPHQVVLMRGADGGPAAGLVDPNAGVPQHRCELLKCLCWPCLVASAALHVLCCRCCRTPRHAEWNTSFEAAVAALRAGANHIGRCMCALRCITDPPLGVVPPWLPSIPRRVGWAKNTLGPKGGEWFWPAAGPPRRSLCCCCPGYPGDPQRLPGLGNPDRFVLYFHGGAFCLCTSKTHRALLMRLVDQTGATVLCPDYRRPPEHPWPIPVSDCLDTYKWVLDEGIGPDKIIFAGDSAGGGLVLAVMGAAKAAGLPLPSGGVLWSPWVDLTDSCSGTWTTNQRTDFLPRDWAVRFARAYAGSHTLAEVSPANVPFSGFPPLLIEVGDAECLHDQVVACCARLEADGVDIQLHVSAGMVHVFPLMYTFSKKGAPPRQAFARAKAFVDQVLGRRRAKPGESERGEKTALV